MSEQETIDRINAELNSAEARHNNEFTNYMDRIFALQKKQKQIEYNEKYIANHKDYLKQNITCLVCNKEYQRWNRSNHERTKRHKSAVLLVEHLPDYTDNI